MIKRILMVGLLVLFTGCSSDVTLTVDVDNKITSKYKEASEFILTCAKNANPLSDEEGEDLVYQCQKTAERIYAELIFGYCYTWKDYCYDSEQTPCKLAVRKEEREACRNKGYRGEFEKVVK
jgi:hypothetical protein